MAMKKRELISGLDGTQGNQMGKNLMYFLMLLYTDHQAKL
jgi:hypothetical protein